VPSAPPPRDVAQKDPVSSATVDSTSKKNLSAQPDPLPPPFTNVSLQEQNYDLSISEKLELKRDHFQLYRLPGAVPKQRPNYRMSETQIHWLNLKVDQLLRDGFIKQLSPKNDEGWNSPIQLVRKPEHGPQLVIDGVLQWRMTINFAPTVNPQIENDTYPLPVPISLLQHMSKYKHFVKLDLSNGYWRMITIDEKTIQMLAFTVPGRGRFAWTVLAQGLKVAPSIFQRFTDDITEPFRNFCRVYIDDIIIGGDTYEECSRRRDLIIDTLTKWKCKINKDKSIFDPLESIPALGYILSHDSITPTNAYLDRIQAFNPPKEAKDLRKFLGLLSHILRFYPNLRDRRITLQKYLTSAKNRTFKWSDRINSVFKQVKEILNKPQELSHLDPDPSIPVTIVTDAGEFGYAATLSQKGKLCGFISRMYDTKAIKDGGSTLREFFGLREALKYFQPHIVGRTIDVITDNKSLVDIIYQENQATPYLERIHQDIREFLPSLSIKWTTREDPSIQLVDFLGRFSASDKRKIG